MFGFVLLPERAEQSGTLVLTVLEMRSGICRRFAFAFAGRGSKLLPALLCPMITRRGYCFAKSLTSDLIQ